MDKFFLPLLLETEYPDSVLKKINSFRSFKNPKLNTCKIATEQCNVSTDDMNAIAKFIILYLNEKHNAKMSYKEQDNFIDGIRDILENIENQIKDLKELPHQDRYEI